MSIEPAILERIDFFNSLHLIILPTEKCNFRCTYCYEDFSHGVMPREIQDRLVRFLAMRIPKLRKLIISWFGGEPLLAPSVIKSIGFFAKSECDKLNVEYISDITTNGYLLDEECLDWCITAGVKSYQITLDGVGKTHDQSRRLAGGGGTFEKVYGSLVRLKNRIENDLSVTIRAHVNAGTVKEASEFIKMLSTDFSGDERFRVLIRSVGNFGGSNGSNVKEVNDREVIDSLQEFAKSLGLNIVNSNLSDYICYASKPNSFVVRSNGTLGKCTVALNDAENNIGEITATGEVAVDHRLLRTWIAGLESGNRQELACPNSIRSFPVKIIAQDPPQKLA
ncbi:radical SAM protein [Paraburkholderia sediminicola]|uniref:radical SAM protein n=1 Tax=Paraburkholderia sediminicola TaxID=458836 RepID=UPI0038B6F84F